MNKVYVLDCNSDVVWCFASCTDFVNILLYTEIHDFATLKLGMFFKREAGLLALIRATLLLLLLGMDDFNLCKVYTVLYRSTQSYKAS